MSDLSDHRWYATLEAGTDDPYTSGRIRDEHEVRYDEPEFLEYGAGNDDFAGPVDNMIASLAACQVSVLKQCFEKARIEDFHIEADVYNNEVDRETIPEEMPSNTAQRIRHLTVDIRLDVPEEDEARARRCAEVYDAGCIVGQSFRVGIEYTPAVEIESIPRAGSDE